MSVYVGAYPLLIGRPDDAAELWARLAPSPHVSGLEVPWTPELTVHELRSLRASLPEHWRFLITMIPGTLGRMGTNPVYGLASQDADGAAAAVADLAAVRALVSELHDAIGSQVVRHVEVHSAPRQSAGSSAATLARSLGEARRWQWDDAELVLEHVDAAVPGQSASKGFLALEEELTVLADTGVGLVINWGRSAIETRSASGPEQHIGLARDAKVLRGLMFSGASAADVGYGPAWSDEHLPLADYAPGSLLTTERVSAAVTLAGPGVFLGAKMGWAGHPATMAAAATMLERTAELLTSLSPTSYVAR